MKINLMLVEDDPVLGKSVNQFLTFEGFEVSWAQRFQDAKALIAERKFDICLLDIGLPDGTGLELCKHIRETDSLIPILFLTAQTDEETLVKAFDVGGNDFLKKPFNQKELIVRLKALTRHLSKSNVVINIGEIQLNLEKRELSYKEKSASFNNTEISILNYLFSNAEKVVTRDKLIKFLGKENDIFDRTIDSHMSHIRKELKDRGFENLKIKSIYGVGYKLEIE